MYSWATSMIMKERKWTWSYYPHGGGSIVYPPGATFEYWQDAKKEALRLEAKYYMHMERMEGNKWIVTSCWATYGKVTP